jgi:hypothetical protein
MKTVLYIAILCFSALAFTYNAKAQNVKEIRKSFTIDKTGEVVIDTYKGKITVEPSNNDVVDVYIKIEPDDNFMGSSAKSQLENASVDIEASSHSVRFKTVYKHDEETWFGSNTRAYVNYVVKMPKKAMLKVKDYKSESHITGLESALEFETYKGKAEIKQLVGAVKLETYKGEVDVKYSKLTGDSRFETYKGDITISLPKDAAFTVNTKFGHRVDFDNDFKMASSSSEKKKREYYINGNVNGGGPEIKLSSEKGSFKLLAE